MRIIKETQIDFMSRTFLAGCLSAILIIIGTTSIIMNGGPKLSIDFKGGTLVAVNFTEPVDINKIRSSMAEVSIDGQTFAVIAVGPAVLDLRELVFLCHSLIISFSDVIIIGLKECSDCHVI